MITSQDNLFYLFIRSEFNFNFLFLSGNTELIDQIDFTADMQVISTNNVSTYDVYINSMYYGTDIDRIQITTNDILKIQITKDDNSKDANILFDNKLYGN